MRNPIDELIAGHVPSRCVVIAELGVNHNGRLDRALELLDAACRAGADAIKLQLFVPAELCSRLYRPDELAMLERLRLSDEACARIVAAARQRGMPVVATPFDSPSLDLLRRLEIPLVKIGSGEVTHTPFLAEVAATGLPVMLSSGGCQWSDLDRAVETLRGGRPEKGHGDTGTKGRREVSVPASLRPCVPTSLSLLHCVSAYPPPDDQMHLRLIPALAQRYPGCAVGLSDHTLGCEAAVAAVALGARIVEKHLTLNCSDDGPDHAASADPAAFAALVSAIRRVEALLGPDGAEKRIQPCEGVIGRSVVAARALAAGTTLTPADLAFKRPGRGVRPYAAVELLGRRLRVDLPVDELIRETDLDLPIE